MNWPSVWESRQRREKAEWQRWFAWYPVRISNRYYWLETILRWEMWTHGYYTPSYKPLEWKKR
jgi:hypothetical protein